ncbi:MAG: serine/threonine-protein kinase [Kofleriaceae bacterium]
MPIPGVQAQARLGRYELLARLATGGMGEIFLARLEGAAGFEKLYVVKRILPHLADDTRFRQMLISEAQIAAKMAHGNICQVYELGETAGQLYIVMEYLEGITTLPLLRRSSKAQVPLEFGLVAAVVQQCCDALHYAHELKDRDGESLGLVHRDVTPSNVFLTESGVVKILDFGIAKAKGATSTKTEDGAVKGKYAYMAPEQLRGGAIDRRVDLFALGVVMYEMVALRRLFQRKTDYLTFRAVMEQPIPDIRRYRPDIPEPVANVIARALEREPAQRFDSARQLGNALLDAMNAVGMRPWTQGDIGDMVKANFADDIAKRSQQVATAVSRTQPGAISQRTTMPLIAQDDAHEHETDDDDFFPSVETDVDSAPRFVAPQPQPEQSDAFGQSTPPPFAAESTGSAPSLRPIQGAPQVPTQQQQPIVVVGQRSYIWPTVAVAMIVVAGAALYLVWQQTQKQPPAQAPIIVQTSPNTNPVQVPDAGSAAVVVEEPKSGSATAPQVRQHPPTVVRPKSINDTLTANYKALNDCLMTHGSGVTDKMVAHVTYSPAGKTKMVQIDPPSQNTAPLGACFRNVLMAAQFPTAAADQTFQFDLKAKTN